MSGNNRKADFEVIKSPLITEKAVRLAEKHKYISFLIRFNATKQEVKVAVESAFKVEVASVRVVNIAGKKKNTRNNNVGKRAAKRKAYVELKPGFDINFSGA